MLFIHEGKPQALLRTVDEFGFACYDLVGLPRRLCEKNADHLVSVSVDQRRVKPLEAPARLAL